MRAKLPGIDSAFGYSIYLCAGVLTWSLFIEIVSRSANVFIENGNLLKKISFPRICLPAIVLLSALVNFAIAYGLFLIFLLVTGHLPSWPLLGLIPLLFIQIIFSVGLGMVAGVLNVFFRDIGQALAIILQCNMSAVQITNLGKAYKQYSKRWSRLAEWLGWGHRHQLTWILRGIDFRLESGEALGIIGVNGAGKSTLLKLIVGTTMPTEGQISLHGRVSALLELGMGFHPEFTGRQNVIMAGQLSGLAPEEIQDLMPSIEAFAEIGDYIDQPLRIYSSGMQMRLAFSVATARRPDILIVDEALSVGDDYFQHKSFERIRDFRHQGTTLLLVSHAREAIQSICDRAILLADGALVREGQPQAVFDYYNALLADRKARHIVQTSLPDGETETTSGSGEAIIQNAEMLDASGQPAAVFDVGAAVELRVRVQVLAPIPRLVLGILIKDRLGQAVYGTNTHHQGRPVADAQPGESIEYRCAIPLRLGPGSYSLTLALHQDDTHLGKNYHWCDRILIFQVDNVTKPLFIGCSWLDPRINIERHPPASSLSQPQPADAP